MSTTASICFLASLNLILASSALAGPCTCFGDLDGNGAIDGADLGRLLANWDGPGADLNGDGTTDGADLGLLLGVWGPCGAPVNDVCASAQPLPVTNATLNLPFCNINATTDGPVLSNCGLATGILQDLWYQYTPKSNGRLTLSTCGQATFDTVIAVYQPLVPNNPVCPIPGPSNPAPQIACNDDTGFCPSNTSFLEVDVLKDRAYKIRLGSFAQLTGTGTLSISFKSEGSQCFDPIPGGSGTNFSFIGNTIDNPVGQTPSCSTGPALSEWIVWTTPCTGWVTVSTCHPETEFDTVLAIWREQGGVCNGLLVECEDDTNLPACDLPGQGSKSQKKFFSDQGTTYFIQVTGWNGAAGQYRLTISADCI